jgi:hypothetical protein
MTEEQPELVTMTVTLNGTDSNRWNKWGLNANPFPQTAIVEFHNAERQIASLDGDPITSDNDIRDRLAGFSTEFVEGVVLRWRPGQRISFDIIFPRDRHVTNRIEGGGQ